MEARRLLYASPLAPAQGVIEQVQPPATMTQEAFATWVTQLQQVGQPIQPHFSQDLRAAAYCCTQDKAMCRDCRLPTRKPCACFGLSLTQISTT